MAWKADILFPYNLFKYNILQKYPMPSLKKLVIIGGPFPKKIQKAVAKIMPHTQILNCYGNNQIIKPERLFDNQNAVIFKKISKKYHEYHKLKNAMKLRIF